MIRCVTLPNSPLLVADDVAGKLWDERRLYEQLSQSVNRSWL